MSETWRMPNGRLLFNVHRGDDCKERACVVHNPTDHHMSTWPLHWRDDRAIFERICEHFVGHPDPDQYEYWEQLGQEYQAVHGCCAETCCVQS